jgi:chloramphenicol O-acetyltransferase
MLHTLIHRFEGRLLAPERLSSYQRWAYQFFHTDHLADPHLSITISLHLTEARVRYEQAFAQTPGASFTAYLTYQLVQALKIQPDFHTRHVGGQWYAFDNLPLYFPVAVGGDRRFKDVIIENVNRMDWPAFALAYRQAVDGEGLVREEYAGAEAWHLFTFIGNLPYLPFTSLTLHRSATHAGRPFFYFGQRQMANGQLQVPLSITLDHANTDPFLLNALLADYQQRLEAAPSPIPGPSRRQR